MIASRWASGKGPGITTKPVFGSRASVATTVSSSAPSLTGAAIASTRKDSAAALKGFKKCSNGEVPGLNKNAARLSRGATSLSSSSHLPPSLPFSVALGRCHEHADPPHALVLLRARRERPRRRTAERQDERAPL